MAHGRRLGQKSPPRGTEGRHLDGISARRRPCRDARLGRSFCATRSTYVILGAAAGRHIDIAQGASLLIMIMGVGFSGISLAWGRAQDIWTDIG